MEKLGGDVGLDLGIIDGFAALVPEGELSELAAVQAVATWGLDGPASSRRRRNEAITRGRSRLAEHVDRVGRLKRGLNVGGVEGSP